MHLGIFWNEYHVVICSIHYYVPPFWCADPLLLVPFCFCPGQSIVLASTFAVSHNVAESKPDQAGQTQNQLYLDLVNRDWGVQQILTSANWGGVVGNFFTGGLNLQVCVCCCEYTRSCDAWNGILPFAFAVKWAMLRRH